MAYDRLICPTCKCPLDPPSGSAAGMSCTRCNAWVDIDPKCTGGCISCHKTRAGELATACTTDDAVVVKIERTARPEQSYAESDNDKGKKNVAEKGLKSLFKKLFAVI